MKRAHESAAEIVERIDDAFFALDDEWRFTYLNDRATDVLDARRDEVIGEVIWDEFSAAVNTTFQHEYEQAMETQETVSFEEYYPPLERWFEVTAYPSETGLSVYFNDVTERRAYETELERYETIVETTHEGIYVVDSDGQFTMVNEAYAEMLGYERADLLGTSVTAVVSEAAADRAAALGDELATEARKTATMTATLTDANGAELIAEATFSLLPNGDRVGIVRDITERRERERELHDRIRQQEGVTELGEHALDTQCLDDLMDEAVSLVAETLDTDYCKVLDLNEAGDELLLRQGVGWDEGLVGEAAVSAVNQNSQAAHTLDASQPIVVDDLVAESRFSGPALLTDHRVRSGISTIIGPTDEPWGVLGTHDTARRTFSDYDVNFVQSVANILGAAIRRHQSEAALRRQHERLSAINDINSLVHGLSESMFNLSTQNEIRALVCNQLATSDSYEFAWVGAAEDDAIVVNAEAGDEDYLNDAIRSLDAPPDERAPTAHAHRTGQMQVVRDVDTDPVSEQWQAHAHEHGYCASAAIPLVGGREMYGTLTLYSKRADAFGDEEREALERLGAIIAHALSSVERDRALEHERNRLEFMNRLLRHNLLNSLNVIEARLDMLDGRVDYEVTEHLDTALGRTREMIDFVETVRKVTTVIEQREEEEQDLNPVDIENVLTTRIDHASDRYPGAEFDVSPVPSVDVLADDLLTDVLDNVLINAVQHNPSPTPTVWVDVTTDGDDVVVSVADDGPGIPDEQKADLFGSEVKTFDDPGSGFGLYLVNEILAAYGSDIVVEDNDPEGACFRLVFQRA